MSPVSSDSSETTPRSDESKRDRFVRIAARRTQHVMERLRILGNCSNRTVYEYTPEDVEKIFGAIQEEIAEARRRFQDRKRKRDDFTL